MANLPDHVTNDYTCRRASELLKVAFPDEEGLEDLPFVFFDTWGFENEEFDEYLRLFRHMVRGKVPLGTERTQTKNLDLEPPSLERHIHCLLIVLQFASYLDGARMAQVTRVIK